MMTTDTVTEGVEAEEKQRLKLYVPKPFAGVQEDFVRCMALRQIWKAGRRGGKTKGSAIKALEAFLGVCGACGGDGCKTCDNTGKVERKRVLYAAPTAEQVGKFWFEVVKALSPGIDAGNFKKNETERFAEVPGTEIRVKGKTAWNASTMRGDWGDLVIMEEYQLWNEDAWQDIVQPMLIDRNGIAVFIFTPPSLKGEGVSKAKDPRHASKLYKKYDHDESGRWKVFYSTSYDNPSLSKDALRELTESGDMSRDSYRREILAQDDEIEESWLVYSKFNEGVCRVPRFTIPDTWQVISGHDFGAANPAALFAARVQLPLPKGAPAHLRYGDYVIFREYAPGAGFSTVQHIEKFKEMAGERKVDLSLGGNVTSEGEIRSGYGAQGWPIAAPLLTKVNAQIDRVIGLMEVNKLYIFDDLYGLWGQIASCMWELDRDNKPTNKVKDEAKHHLLADLRYMCTCIPAERSFFAPQGGRIKIKVY